MDMQQECRPTLAIFLEPSAHCWKYSIYVFSSGIYNIGRRVFQKFILGDSSFYCVSNKGIVLNILCNVPMFLQTLFVFPYQAIFYSIFGWLEDNVLLFLYSKKKIKTAFFKNIQYDLNSICSNLEYRFLNRTKIPPVLEEMFIWTGCIGFTSLYSLVRSTLYFNKRHNFSVTIPR